MCTRESRATHHIERAYLYPLSWREGLITKPPSLAYNSHNSMKNCACVCVRAGVRTCVCVCVFNGSSDAGREHAHLLLQNIFCSYSCQVGEVPPLKVRPMYSTRIVVNTTYTHVQHTHMYNIHTCTTYTHVHNIHTCTTYTHVQHTHMYTYTHVHNIHTCTTYMYTTPHMDTRTHMCMCPCV